MIRLLVLNRQFATGGAERQLITLLQGIDRSRFDITVASFYYGGGLCHEVSEIRGIKWVPLYKQGRWDVIRFLTRLWKLTKQIQPDIIYGYMGPSHHISLILGKCFGAKVVWGVRASNMDSGKQDRLTRLSFWVECKLSKFSDAIIANSDAGKRYVIEKGFLASKIHVIPNGIDVLRFCPDRTKRAVVREKWGISVNDRVIGIVARLHPMKDHLNFLKAADALCQRYPDVKFVCVGGGTDAYAKKLKQLPLVERLSGRLLWDGERADVSSIYNAIDLLCSTSAYGEGFSNTIAEAMACGVPCVVTDVGDSASIVGSTGLVVPPRDFQALAVAMEQTLNCLATDTEICHRVRTRIVQHFTDQLMVAKTESVLSDLRSF